MIPEIFPVIDGLVSWEMDQSPTYTISPASLPHTDFYNLFSTMANDLETVLQASYQVNSEEVEIAKAQWQKYVNGTGILKTTWDMTLAGGQGDAITRFVPVESFYPDPMATNITDGSYYVEAKLMSIQELDRRSPGTAKLFPSGGTDYDVDSAHAARRGRHDAAPHQSRRAGQRGSQHLRPSRHRPQPQHQRHGDPWCHRPRVLDQRA